MKPLKWDPNPMRLVFLREKEEAPGRGTRDAGAQRRKHVRTRRRQPWASQGERPLRKSSLPTP